MKWLSAFINFLLYGNFWIAFAAICSSWQTSFLLQSRFENHQLHIFIFFATLFLYSLHRYVGLKEVKSFSSEGRFLIIKKFKNHILAFALVASVASFFLFWTLPTEIQLALIPAALVSLSYVLPVLDANRRLRDLNFIKIFLIALSWAWISVILPAIHLEQFNNPAIWIMFVERSFFILAITLPFDIRDLQLDAHSAVRTIPSWLGVRKTKIVANLLLVLSLFLAGWNYFNGFYKLGGFIAILLSLFISQILINNSSKEKHDYYFSGLIDGLIVLQFILVILFALIF